MQRSQYQFLKWPDATPWRNGPQHPRPAASSYHSVPLRTREQLYRPLHSWQIRLLKVHASVELASPIVCDLHTADLIAFPGVGLVEKSTVVECDALSYSWGYPALTHSILCNGLLFPVGEALHDALRHLRGSDHGKYLWCDACCIDQTNFAEKAVQVQNMFTIFQKAQRVVAWLGLPSPEAELLFQYIAANSGKQETQQRPRLLQHSNAVSSSISDALTHRYLRHGQAQKAARKWITNLAYLKRCWIRQEVQAANGLSLLCGRFSSSFVDFIAAVDSLLPEYDRSRQNFSAEVSLASRDRLLYEYFRDQHNLEPIPRSRGDWFEIIMRGAVYESTLPQDKIFSMLSIAARLDQDEEGQALQVDGKAWSAVTGFPDIDYEKSVSLVFQDFIKHTINLEASLGCLGVFEDRSARTTDLPSWAIDLRLNIPRYLNRSEVQEYYDAIRPQKQILTTMACSLSEGIKAETLTRELKSPFFGLAVLNEVCNTMDPPFGNSRTAIRSKMLQ